MGEYFKDHKLGTCDHLMYITREEVQHFAMDAGNGELAQYLRLDYEFLYRFPRKNDQARTLDDIDRREPFDYIRIEVCGLDVLHKEFAQVKMTFGNCDTKVYNLNFCPANPAHFDIAKPTQLVGWNPPNGQIRQTIEIIGNRYTENRPEGYTLFRCPVCDQWFSCDQREIDDFIRPVMIERGLEYEASFLKADRAED